MRRIKQAIAAMQAKYAGLSARQSFVVAAIMAVLTRIKRATVWLTTPGKVYALTLFAALYYVWELWAMHAPLTKWHAFALALNIVLCADCGRSYAIRRNTRA